MKGIPQNVSDTVRKLNPHLYQSVGAVEIKVAESTTTQALASPTPKRKRSSSRACIIIRFTAFRKAMFDDDNLVASLKPLRDALAKLMEIDDNDPRIVWECGQVHTHGEEGVNVQIVAL